jgi:hypothetical protein
MLDDGSWILDLGCWRGLGGLKGVHRKMLDDGCWIVGCWMGLGGLK